MKLAYFPNLQMHIVWLELEALPTFTGDLRQRPLKLYLIILLQCIRVRITRCDPCRVHLDSRLQDYWEDDGGQHTVDDNIYILYLSLSVYHIYEHIYPLGGQQTRASGAELHHGPGAAADQELLTRLCQHPEGGGATLRPRQRRG